MTPCMFMYSVSALSLQGTDAAAGNALCGAELEELVRHLKLKWQSVNEAYQRLPMVLDTPSKKRRKEVRKAKPCQAAESGRTVTRCASADHSIAAACRRWRPSWQRSSGMSSCCRRPRSCMCTDSRAVTAQQSPMQQGTAEQSRQV